MPICDAIRGGKIPSQRHQEYGKGMIARKGLNRRQFSSIIFSEEVNDMSIRWYQHQFPVPKRFSNRQLDYFLRVLQQELFKRIFADITGCDFAEAEKKMAEMVYKQSEIPKELLEQLKQLEELE